ncbi:hypothetical protein BCR34DRAFT_657916 [Clohesyomyces aquaticus]|uniref:Uncharacterized protein n=1 Tax=Clohesyomyces aquaticus TaxID=1231657 RepID=A0A1Y1ZF86_9PLEO|nr:hypothetical protein BCR34DRAFT_657916 [Clohesyomyces aquaticus]
MFPQWEMSYYAVNYLPVCGASTELEGDGYWSNSPECESAITTFNATTLQVALYDTAGVQWTAKFGQGTSLCMCYTVSYTPKDGHLLDICLLVGGNGEIIIRSGVAAGLQSPERKKSKALPQCKDVDLGKYSQGSGSPTSAYEPAATSSSAATPTQGGGNSHTIAPASEGSKSGGGLSTESKIALGVGLPGAITSTAAIIWWFVHRSRR